MAVYTPIKLMLDLMMTSYNCYISGIFQSLHITFINMHQNVNIHRIQERLSSELLHCVLRIVAYQDRKAPWM